MEQYGDSQSRGDTGHEVERILYAHCRKKAVANVTKHAI